VVTVVVPLLKGKSKTLVLKKFRVKLILVFSREKDDLKVVDVLVIAGARNTLGFTVGD
jgi:hypothetical protein